MLAKHQSLALYMEGNLDKDTGKMGVGLIRFSENPIGCVIDSRFAGKNTRDLLPLDRDVPIVGSVAEAVQMGCEVLVLGIAPSGGRFPQDWDAPVVEALESGMSLVNGLHDDLGARFAGITKKYDDQYIWDVRKVVQHYPIATAQAARIANIRILMVGTDMASGKMTTGLLLERGLRGSGRSTGFVATGQIGMVLTGSGIPLDAVKVDQAAGAVETAVLAHADKEIVVVEGQGSLAHPGSTATLPLLRGSCPTHLILCHKARFPHLREPVEHIPVPPIDAFIALNEAVAAACGSLPVTRTLGVALNTSGMTEDEAEAYRNDLAERTGLPVTDPVRWGVEPLVEAVTALFL